MLGVMLIVFALAKPVPAKPIAAATAAASNALDLIIDEYRLKVTRRGEHALLTFRKITRLWSTRISHELLPESLFVFASLFDSVNVLVRHCRG